jgi:hypothetical protein
MGWSDRTGQLWDHSFDGLKLYRALSACPVHCLFWEGPVYGPRCWFRSSGLLFGMHNVQGFLSLIPCCIMYVCHVWLLRRCICALIASTIHRPYSGCLGIVFIGPLWFGQLVLAGRSGAMSWREHSVTRDVITDARDTDRLHKALLQPTIRLIHFIQYHFELRLIGSSRIDPRAGLYSGTMHVLELFSHGQSCSHTPFHFIWLFVDRIFCLGIRRHESLTMSHLWLHFFVARIDRYIGISSVSLF